MYSTSNTVTKQGVLQLVQYMKPKTRNKLKNKYSVDEQSTEGLEFTMVTVQ